MSVRRRNSEANSPAATLRTSHEHGDPRTGAPVAPTPADVDPNLGGAPIHSAAPAQAAAVSQDTLEPAAAAKPHAAFKLTATSAVADASRWVSKLDQARLDVFQAHQNEPYAEQAKNFDARVEARFKQLKGDWQPGSTNTTQATSVAPAAVSPDPEVEKQVAVIRGASVPVTPKAVKPMAAKTAAMVANFQPALQASQRPGMGANYYGGGTTFRVWAPNADKVFVAGDFNGWLPTEIGNEYNGNFSIDYPGAMPGQKYKFVIETNGGTNSFYRVDPRAYQVESSTGNSIIYDQGAYQWQHDWDFKMPGKNQMVMYEMHIGTYDDSPGWGPGNFDSAIAKLDHLKDIGVNAVEVMPSAEFPGDFSWGYNPSDPFAVESSYGGPDAMKRFVDACHARGIAVILDCVYNHFGPTDLPLWQFDGTDYGNGNNGGIYFYNDGRGQTPWGNTRPNYGWQPVRDYILDNVRMWVNQYHADGVRLDATYSMEGAGSDGWSMMQDIANVVHQSGPQKMVIAEDMQDNDWVTKPTSQGGAGADAQWDAKFIHKVADVATAPNDQSVDMNGLVQATGRAFNGDPFQNVKASETHDEDGNGSARIPSRVGGWDVHGYNALKKSMQGILETMFAPGIPMIEQGQEFAQDGSFAAESPLNWDYLSQLPGFNQAVGDAARLKRDWYDTTRGLSGSHFNIFHNADGVEGIHRWDQGGPRDDTIVLHNNTSQTLQNYTVGLPRGGTWKVRFNSDSKAYSPLFGDTQTFDVNTEGGGWDGLPEKGQLTIGPYSTVVLSQDN